MELNKAEIQDILLDYICIQTSWNDVDTKLKSGRHYATLTGRRLERLERFFGFVLYSLFVLRHRDNLTIARINVGIEDFGNSL